MAAVVDPRSLGSLALFRELPEEALRFLADRLRRKVFPAGASVLTAEQPGEALYVILEGSVRIFLDEADGSEVTLAFLGPGDSVGEMSLVDRSGRSANVAALEESTLLWLDRDTFLACLRQFPGLSENLMREMAARLRAANQQIRALTTLDVAGRVARQLLVFAEVYGVADDNGGIRIPMPLPQRAIADLVGATRERVNRVLVSLRRRQTLSVDSHYRVTLHDRQALEELCRP
jgi:CRP/FNR family cyclic AMP-dependent transcriptional regulator